MAAATALMGVAGSTLSAAAAPLAAVREGQPIPQRFN
jgi:hypothetical protein